MSTGRVAKLAMLAWVCATSACAEPSSTLDSTVMTFNVRWSDLFSNTYPARVDCMAEIVAESQVDIVGLQEMRDDVAPVQTFTDALAAQAQAHGIEFEGFSGATRLEDCDMFDECGLVCASPGDCEPLDPTQEQLPIYWNTARYEWMGEGVHKLPPAVSTVKRTLPWVELRDRADGGMVVAYNVHLDYHTLGAQYHAEKIVEVIRANGHADPDVQLIVLGDFNLYWSVGEERAIVERLATRLDVEVGSGLEERTYHAFMGGTRGSPVDYVMHSRHWSAPEFGALTGTDDRCPTSVVACDLAVPGPGCTESTFVTNGYPSDHYPVWTRLTRARR